MTPRISPDGEKCVYSVQWVDQESEKKFSNFWMAEVNGVAPLQFTVGNHVDASPQWSPDGGVIAFLSNRGSSEKPAQLFRISPSGGEARQMCDFPGSIEKFLWSPDGSKILLVATKTDDDTLAREADEKKRKLGVVSRTYDRVRFKYDGVGFLSHEVTHLWLLDTETGTLEQLTGHALYADKDPAWSPDGQRVIFVSNRSDRPDFHPANDDLYTIDLVSRELRKIITPIGLKQSPSFSPDGKWIAYFGVEGEYTWHETNHLWLIPADGSVPPVNLLRGTDYTCASSTLNDTGSAEQMPPTWAPNSDVIYFQVDYHGSSKVMGVKITDGSLFDVIGEGGIAGSFHFSDDHAVMSFTYGDQRHLPEVYTQFCSTRSTHQISHQNDEFLAELDLGHTEEIWFKGPDGNDLQGWVLYPPQFDPQKQYASILEIHGGPTAQYGNAFMHEFYTLAANDLVVYYTNPRGGTGYGDAHCKAIWGDWGNRDYADLMAWVDLIADKPFIDQRRMGVTGGSYGGYMTVWIIGHTNRFKAAVSQRCVSNLTSMWGSSDGNWVFQQIFGNKTPFEDVEVFWKHSPIAYIGNAKTPTLIIHSENDLRCPIEQSEQVFVALKYLDVPTEMLRFPDESHGLSRNGRTDRRVMRLKSMQRWFNQYL
jgi:dipeptidyl aminopeptidase/acylaminoacyl peptidase